MNKEKRKSIKRKIYNKFGWTLEWWAKSRGFSRWQVYDTLYGRSGKNVAQRVLNALKEDNILTEVERESAIEEKS